MLQWTSSFSLALSSASSGTSTTGSLITSPLNEGFSGMPRWASASLSNSNSIGAALKLEAWAFRLSNQRGSRECPDGSIFLGTSPVGARRVRARGIDFFGHVARRRDGHVAVVAVKENEEARINRGRTGNNRGHRFVVVARSAFLH